MIAKEIGPRKKRKAPRDFRRLARYVVDAKGGVDPAKWTRTAGHTLDLQHGTDKVGAVRITNCISIDVALATQEIIDTQQRNERAQGERSFHLLVSFRAPERPSLEQLRYIEDELCRVLGFEEHQRISAVHIDTAHLHLHVAINKIHPRTLRCISPFRSKEKLMAACDRLEDQLGLQRTYHGRARAPAPGASVDLDSPSNPTEPITLYRPAPPPDKPASAAQWWTTNRSKAEKNGGAIETITLPAWVVAAHSVRARGGTDERIFPGEENHPQRLLEGLKAGRIPEPAADMEAHSGQQSFVRWLRENVLPQLKACNNWQSLHAALAERGLEARRRGDGLVICQEQLCVRASQVDRELSLHALTKRFGAFEPAAPDFAQRPRRAPGYRGATRRRPSTDALYERYQRERRAASDRRADMLSQLRAQWQGYGDQLVQWYEQERARLLKDRRLRGRAKYEALKALSQSRAQDLLERREGERRARQRVYSETHVPGWEEWLLAQAQDGDAEAMAVLKYRAERSASKNDGATGEPGAPRQRPPPVPIHRNTDAAARAALYVAQVRFAGEALIVNGSDELRARVARIAGEQHMSVRFLDEKLEQIRVSAAAAPPPSQPPGDLHEYIAQRNALHERGIKDVLKHRLFVATDAGEVIYCGIRHFRDGSAAYLLQQGDIMLVLPVSPEATNASGARRWARGDVLTVEPSGELHAPRQRGGSRA